MPHSFAQAQPFRSPKTSERLVCQNRHEVVHSASRDVFWSPWPSPCAKRTLRTTTWAALMGAMAECRIIAHPSNRKMQGLATTSRIRTCVPNARRFVFGNLTRELRAASQSFWMTCESEDKGARTCGWFKSSGCRLKLNPWNLKRWVSWRWCLVEHLLNTLLKCAIPRFLGDDIRNQSRCGLTKKKHCSWVSPIIIHHDFIMLQPF